MPNQILLEQFIQKISTTRICNRVKNLKIVEAEAIRLKMLVTGYFAQNNLMNSQLKIINILFTLCLISQGPYNFLYELSPRLFFHC